MYNLDYLIKKFGPTDVLIDHWASSSNRFAIWGFEEEFFIDSVGRSFMNGKLIEGTEPMEAWQDAINKWKSSERELSAMGYISYD